MKESYWKRVGGMEEGREGQREKKEGVKLHVVRRRKGRSSRVSITSFPRLKAAGQWGVLERLTRPREPRDVPIVPNTDGKKETSRSMDEYAALLRKLLHPPVIPIDRLSLIRSVLNYPRRLNRTARMKSV